MVSSTAEGEMLRTVYLMLFASQVFLVHSAYSFAAGSLFARIPTRCGTCSNLERPSRTSERRDAAIVPARMVLHAVVEIVAAEGFAVGGPEVDMLS